MMITEPQIRRIMPNAKSDKVKAFVITFNEWSDKFGINTPLRIAHFLGHVAHESGELNTLSENLSYSAQRLMQVWPTRFRTRAVAEQYAYQPEKIANKVYANRMGNGSEASGDGWRYRGRGIIQLTGKQNYRDYQKSGYCVGDLLSHPEWLEQYPGALKSAMWFWWKNGLNELADRDDTAAITRRINGGTNGLAQRGYFTRIAKRVLCI